MKTIAFLRKDSVSVFCTAMLILGSLNMGYSQTHYPIAYNLPSPYNVGSLQSVLKQCNYGNLNYLSVGIPDGTLPSALFHVVHEPLPTTPIFKTEAPSQQLYPAAISQIFKSQYLDTLFGLYQQNSSVINFFEGATGIGNKLYLKGARACLTILDKEPFPVNMGTSDTPMEIYSNKVKINDTMACKNFRMTDGASSGKFLMSDSKGNGSWSDVSGFNDNDWLINSMRPGTGDIAFNILYANPIYPRIGIGTSTPFNTLHVENGNILVSRSNYKSDKEFGSVFFGDTITSNTPKGKWGIQYYNHGLNFARVHYTGDTVSPDTLVYFNDNSTVGIGIKDTKGFKLGVDGKIICEELKVRNSINWPDYVLQKDYKLIPLKELESYISENQHLPGIPSAKDVETNGIAIGEMNKALLEKIEELTRYIIEQDKRIDDLKRKLESR